VVAPAACPAVVCIVALVLAVGRRIRLAIVGRAAAGPAAAAFRARAVGWSPRWAGGGGDAVPLAARLVVVVASGGTGEVLAQAGDRVARAVGLVWALVSFWERRLGWHGATVK
jgi:hypothetical protein